MNKEKPHFTASAQSLRLLLKDPGHFLSLGLGSGLAPTAPGTAGTAAAIPLYLALAFGGTWVYFIGLAVVIAAGIYLCDRTSRVLGQHDHPAIVWDEFAGFLVTMVWVPVAVDTVLAGFILFRVFDVWKPWPISQLDRRVKGGLGVMLDDLVAGIYAAVIMQLLLHYKVL
jgi:phosphatidylglycerophosphatase A